MTNQQTSLDTKLNAMKPGATLILGENTWAERSGDGKTLRFVRQEGNAQVVFQTSRF
jgi:hypothetical protein